MSRDETRFCEFDAPEEAIELIPGPCHFRSKARNLLLAGSGNAADRRADSTPANAVSE